MAVVGTWASGAKASLPTVAKAVAGAVARVEIREWYVTTRGGEPVGPVSTDLIARGIFAGKVPRSALVARVGDSVWQRVMLVPEITTALEFLSLQAAVPPSGVRGAIPGFLGDVPSSPEAVGTQEAS